MEKNILKEKKKIFSLIGFAYLIPILGFLVLFSGFFLKIPLIVGGVLVLLILPLIPMTIIFLIIGSLFQIKDILPFGDAGIQLLFTSPFVVFGSCFFIMLFGGIIYHKVKKISSKKIKFLFFIVFMLFGWAICASFFSISLTIIYGNSFLFILFYFFIILFMIFLTYKIYKRLVYEIK